MIKPPLKSLFHIPIPRGTSCIFQLRVGKPPEQPEKTTSFPGYYQ